MKKQQVTEQVMVCLCENICRNGSQNCCVKAQRENTTGKHCLKCPNLHWQDNVTFHI